MDLVSIFLVFLIHFKHGCLALGECKDGPTVVATVTQKEFVRGTKDSGFSLTCEVNIIDPTYVMSTWRLERPSSIYVYTYQPPSTFLAGPDYTTRNLKFTNLDTVVFPSYESTDVRKENLTCYLSLNSNGYICNDLKEQNIFAKPTVTVESTPDLSTGVAVDTEIKMDITGTDYMCFEDPSFTVQIGSAPARPLTLTPPPTPGDFSTFTASINFTATETESGEIHVVMTCGDDTATISTDVEVQIDKESAGLPQIVCACVLAIEIVCGALGGLALVSFIIFIIVTVCLKIIKVIPVLQIAVVVLACAAIIGGAVCIGLTSSCDGSICGTDLGLSIAALIIGVLILVFIFFFLGRLFEKCEVKSRHLCGFFPIADF